MKIPLDLFVGWLKSKNLKARTIEEYVYYFNKFVPYPNFSQETISKFLSKKENMNGVARSFLINFQKFLMRNHVQLGISKDEKMEIAEVELPTLSGKKKLRLIKPLTIDQVLLIEKFLPDEKEKLKLLLSFYGGLRHGELLKIQVLSFNWLEWKKDMSQWCECRVFGKGDKEGIAFFPPEATKRVASFIREKNFPSLSSYIFLDRKVEDLSKINIRNRQSQWTAKIKKAAIEAGIVQFNSEGKVIEETDVYPHKLRHSWGYHLRNVKGLDLREIQEILRHSSLDSTQIYVYLDKKEIKDKLKASDGPKNPQNSLNPLDTEEISG